MALVLADRVQQTGVASGTTSFTLSGTVTGFQSFAVVGNGNTTYYSATDTSGNWEVGIGTYATGGTLTRTTILSSSNSGSAVTFSGGVNVFVTYPSEKSVNQDASNNVILPAGLTVPNDASISGLTVGKGGGAVASNTAVGSNALTNSTGSSYGVTGFGYYALAANTSGNSIVAIGANALTSNTTGSSSVAVGHEALKLNTTASNNTAVGYQALYSNTTGIYSTAVGYQALYNSNRTADTTAYNTAIGNAAGYGLTTGQLNIFLGGTTGYQTTTGSNNTFAGYNAGYYVTTGNKNSIFGQYNGNQGGLDIRTASNYIVLSDGDGSVGAYYQTTAAVVGWYQKNNSATWSITSDARIKKNVVSLNSALDVITALRPVEFDYIKNDKHDIGFIAQEYQSVLPEQVAEGQDGMLSLNQNLVPYLVKAIQELKAEIDQLKGK